MPHHPARARRPWGLFLLAMALAPWVPGPVDLGPLSIPDAQAVIGRPLTPVSVAGVARRTTRRAVAYGAATSPYYGAYGYAPPPTYTQSVVVLPTGCTPVIVNGVSAFNCGGVLYRAVYNGPQVMYIAM